MVFVEGIFLIWFKTRHVKKLALPFYGIYKRRDDVGGMHFNCKTARAHVLASLADATLVLQCGKFGILEESPANAWRRSKKLDTAVEWISSECI
ncbi:unnamed protein product [Lasius platythorax]|uniref:Uncharacterized protein n=1 Tax=Lasius platythorax TaxID=488582 RepID=A0AAV2NPD9_9HYME